jgi:hypothetical protein
MSSTIEPGSLGAQLAGRLTVAAPDVVGALAVFPIITDRSSTLDYLALADAVPLGVAVKEMPGGPEVNALVVHNPLDMPVLLYGGEEVLGAQQNRTFDASALVPARASLRVPVSCVEQGRWQHARRDESFVPAPQVAHPALRGRRSEGAGQGEVWEEVASTAARLDAGSETGALHDAFEHHRRLLAEVAARVPVKCSQVGMLVAIGSRFVVLDCVSDVEAFASLQPRLVQGYALQACSAPRTAPPSLEDARDYLDLLLEATPARRPSIGLGESARFEFGSLAGTSLAHGGELVALTAYAPATTA